MAEARVESPLFVTNKPTYEQDLWYNSPLKKRSIENQNALDLLKPSKAEKSTELFPEIKKTLPLPEEEVEVSFDQPAFTAPREKKERKPALPQPEWVAAKSTQTEAPKESWLTGWIPWGREKENTKMAKHRETEDAPLTNPRVRAETSKASPRETEPLIGYHHRVNARGSSQKDKDELAHLPKQGGAILAKLIGMITDYQTMSQSGQLEVFSATSDSLEEIRKKQFALVMEQIRNRKDMETWSYRAEMLEYFGIATGIIGGATLVGASFTTGGTSAVAGYQMLAGSAISLSAKLAGKYFKDNTYTPIVGLGGALVSGWGMAQGMAALGSIPKVLATSSNATMKVSELLISRKGIQTKANQFGMNAKNIKLQYQREDNETTMRKVVGELKSSKESSDLLGAATKALHTENEVKSRIALGSKA
ncbi:hypothetical protein [Candidatus Neptunichlamydia sp. REUL1]|uniref:hypothetical protein n=1 Tax=Candidatus Neptunichlamydia sp. REUL1 TaxID=3064277 RepID=UPI002930B52E|nr:hypothetical protein [Candidatus Neptunochlamydia sp. REUL1]